MAFLVVGLGNPGSQYGRSRHNAGFAAVERVAEKAGIEISRNDFGGSYGIGFYGEHKIIVFKPETYMNNSGEPVRKIMRFYGMRNEKLIVAHDEIDLPVGHVQVKVGGGSAGHNGIKSLVERMGSEFARVRIGVGKPETGMEIADYVLADFSKEERGAVEDSIEKAAEAVCEIVSLGAQSAMGKYNRN